jgi:hypothetical protein
MNEKIVMTAAQYDRIDGRNAYRSDLKSLTLGAPILDENKSMQIAVQLWKDGENGELALKAELPIHQVMDLMIFLSRSMLYFRDAYRMPLLYDPERPLVERIGLQGGAMPITVCTANPNLKEDLQTISQAFGSLGELTGERLRVLSRILEELENY